MRRRETEKRASEYLGYDPSNSKRHQSKSVYLISQVDKRISHRSYVMVGALDRKEHGNNVAGFNYSPDSATGEGNPTLTLPGTWG